ncbi:MAG: hypothetical protein HYT62_03160 [Candidatus Yanofskybacteria bacterium]|nr:hypothetical protein [Candidatus Yanofskybacteria bacterium]
MKIEDIANHFTKTLVLIASFSATLEDIFLAKKLQDKMEILISSYIRLAGQEEDSNVAQYYITEKLISEIDETLGLFEIINRFGVIKKTTPLLLASRSLLSLKLELIKIKNGLYAGSREKERDSKVSVANNNFRTSPISRTPSQKNIYQDRELNPNKEKILNFIKRSPHTRTKDIIHEFSALSDRTVKRNLGELLRVGLVNKKIENKAVYYSAEN